MLICSFKSLHLSGPLGSLFISPSLAVGKSHTHVRSCSSFIGQLFIFVSDILPITAWLLPCLQFKGAFDALLARAPALEQISRTHESQKAALMFEIRHMVTELVRLSTLDPLLSEERRFVADLDAGLEHSILGVQLDTAAVWLHGKLLSSSEEGQQVDRARIVKELSNVSKFMEGAEHRVDRTMPWGGAPMQPLLALTTTLAVTVVAILCIPQHPRGLIPEPRANTGRRGVAEVVAVWALVNSPYVVSVRTRASEGATFCTPTGSAP